MANREQMSLFPELLGRTPLERALNSAGVGDLDPCDQEELLVMAACVFRRAVIDASGCGNPEKNAMAWLLSDCDGLRSFSWWASILGVGNAEFLREQCLLTVQQGKSR